MKWMRINSTARPSTDNPEFALSVLQGMIALNPEFKSHLAADLSLSSTAAIDQWLRRGSVPRSRLNQFWICFENFSDRTTKKVKRK